MRLYNVSDVFTVVDIMSAAIGDGSKLGRLLSASPNADGGDNGQSDEERGYALISYVLGECYAKCRDRLVDWLASLNEMTVAQFNAQPPEAVLDLIEEIATRKESKDFFSRASSLYRKISGLPTTTASA